LAVVVAVKAQLEAPLHGRGPGWALSSEAIKGKGIGGEAAAVPC
jgi:hypothetical protein